MGAAAPEETAARARRRHPRATPAAAGRRRRSSAPNFAQRRRRPAVRPPTTARRGVSSYRANWAPAKISLRPCTLASSKKAIRRARTAPKCRPDVRTSGRRWAIARIQPGTAASGNAPPIATARPARDNAGPSSTRRNVRAAPPLYAPASAAINRSGRAPIRSMRSATAASRSSPPRVEGATRRPFGAREMSIGAKLTRGAGKVALEAASDEHDTKPNPHEGRMDLHRCQQRRRLRVLRDDLNLRESSWTCPSRFRCAHAAATS